MQTLSAPQTSMASTSVDEQPADDPEGAGGEGEAERAPDRGAENEPIMNTSPWAKLISSMIP